MVEVAEILFIKSITPVDLSLSPIHDAFGIAASFVSRNPQNEELVNGLIIAKNQRAAPPLLVVFRRTLRQCPSNTLVATHPVVRRGSFNACGG